MATNNDDRPRNHLELSKACDVAERHQAAPTTDEIAMVCQAAIAPIADDPAAVTKTRAELCEMFGVFNQQLQRWLNRDVGW